MSFKRIRKMWKARSPQVGRWLKWFRRKTKAYHDEGVV